MKGWACSVASVAVLSVLLAGCDLFVGADGHVKRAGKAMAESNYGLATVEYRNALQSKPELTDARAGLVRALLYSGDVQGAGAALQPLLDGAPLSGATADVAAQVYLARGEAQKLLAALDSKRLVLDAEAEQLRRGEALAALGNREEALKVLGTAVPESELHSEVLLARVQVLASMGRMESALEAVRGLTRQYPQFARGWLVRGSLESRTQADSALQSFENAKQHAKGQLTAVEQVALYAGLVETQLARADVSAAKASAAELAKAAPNSIAATLADAQVSLAANDPQSAVRSLQTLVASQPKLYAAKLLLAKALVAAGSAQQADSIAEQIVADVPDSVTARKLLAESKLRLHLPQEAIKTLAPVASATGKDSGLGTLLAAAIVQTSASPEAIASLATTQKRAPGDLPLRVLLARVYVAAKRPADAASLLSADVSAQRDPQAVGLLLVATGLASGKNAAIAQAQKLAEINGDDAGTLGTIAEFLGGQREIKQAEAVLQRASKVDSGNSHLLFAQAHLDAARGDYPSATTALKKIVAADPRNVEAPLELGKIARAQGDAVETGRWLETARSVDRAAVEPRLLLVELYLQTKAADKAAAVAREVAAIAPGNMEIQNSLGQLYLRVGQAEQAKPYFERATQANARQPAYWMNLARAQLLLKDNASARASVEKALELRPDNSAAAALAASIDIRSGDRAAALARAQKYAAAHSQDASGEVLRGDVEMELQDYAQAVAAYQAALAKTPSSDIALRLYRARLALHDPAAPEVLERWLQGHEGDALVRSFYAQTLQTKGDLRRAATEYERLLADKPDDVISANNLAWVYFNMKNPRALALAKTAYGRFPASPSIADTYGWILLDSGETSEAVKILAGAAEKAPGQAEIQYHYAAALAKTGAVGDAQRRLGALLKEHAEFPGREEAQKMLDRLAEGTRTPS